MLSLGDEEAHKLFKGRDQEVPRGTGHENGLSKARPQHNASTLVPGKEAPGS